MRLISKKSSGVGGAPSLRLLSSIGGGPGDISALSGRRGRGSESRRKGEGEGAHEQQVCREGRS